MSKLYAPAKPNKKLNMPADKIEVANSIEAMGDAISKILMALVTLSSLKQQKWIESAIRKITAIQTAMALIAIMFQIYISFFREETPDTRTPEEQVLALLGFVVFRDGCVGYECVPSGECVPTSVFINIKYLLKYVVNNAQIRRVVETVKPDDNNSVEELHTFIAEKTTYLPEMFILFKHPEMDYDVLIRAGGLNGAEIKIWVKSSVDKATQNMKEILQKNIVASVKHNIMYLSVEHYYQRSIVISLTPLETAKYYNAEKVTHINKLMHKAFENNEKLSLMLYGVPGIGKTSAIKTALANTDAIIFSVEPEIMYDDLYKILRDVPDKKILLIEDISYSLKNDDDHEWENLLKILDSDIYDIAIITSNSNKLPPALIRSGRCDCKIKYNLPDETERWDIMSLLSQTYKYPPTDELVLHTENLTHADLNTLYRLAMLNGVSPDEYLPDFLISKRDFKDFDESEGM